MRERVRERFGERTREKSGRESGRERQEESQGVEPGGESGAPVRNIHHPVASDTHHRTTYHPKGNTFVLVKDNAKPRVK